VTRGFAEELSWFQYPRYVAEVALVLSTGISALSVWHMAPHPTQ